MKKLILIVLVTGGLLISSGCARLQLFTTTEEFEDLQTTTYEVRKGDTLWEIADSVYGDPYKWRIIYEANRDKVTNPDRLTPGTVLIIPEELN